MLALQNVVLMLIGKKNVKIDFYFFFEKKFKNFSSVVVKDLTHANETLHGSSLVDTDIDQEEREAFYHCQSCDAKTNLKTTLKDMVLNRVEMVGSDVRGICLN